MSDRLNRTQSAAVGDNAVISGAGAALLVKRLLPANPKAILLSQGITGERLAVALEAVNALFNATANWGEDVSTSAGGSTEGHGDAVPGNSESELWITNSQAADILDVSARSVRYFREEGKLAKYRRIGRDYEYPLLDVIALSRQRKGKK